MSSFTNTYEEDLQVAMTASLNEYTINNSSNENIIRESKTLQEYAASHVNEHVGIEYKEYIERFFKNMSNIDLFPNIYRKDVRGDGNCVIYSFIAFLDSIGTFNSGTYEEQTQKVNNICKEWASISIDLYNKVIVQTGDFLDEIDLNKLGTYPLYVLHIFATFYDYDIVVICKNNDSYKNMPEAAIIKGPSSNYGKEPSDVCFIVLQSGHASFLLLQPPTEIPIEQKIYRKLCYDCIMGDDNIHKTYLPIPSHKFNYVEFQEKMSVMLYPYLYLFQ